MLGKKKQEKEQEPEQPTGKLEVKITSQDKGELLEWFITEYKGQYHGIFGQQDLAELDVDLTSLNLLFAIWAELRLLRELQSQSQAKKGI